MAVNSNGDYSFLNPVSHIQSAQQKQATSFLRLTMGLKITGAKDDASGLAVRELLRADIATANQSSRNVSDGISLIQTADGSAGAVGDLLIRMKELSVQAGNGTYSAQQKGLMQQEFAGLSEQVAQIAASSAFNGISLHQDGQTIQIAIGDGEAIEIDTESISVASGDLTVDPAAAGASVDTAITQLSAYRGSLGSTATRLESVSDVQAIKAESLLAAESRISDADIAKETASKTAHEMLLMAAVAMQAQAQTTAQMVTMLLG